MKIVRFENGAYGVRKFSFFLLGWVFAVNKSGKWAPKNAELAQEFDNLAYAHQVLIYMQSVDKGKRDMGRPCAG